MHQNASYVFFRELQGPEAEHVLGVLEIPLTPGRSLAVDASVHALGTPIYVTAPTLTARDHVYRVSLDGKVSVAWSGFGRPQGLAFGPDGALYIVEALSGAAGLYKVPLDGSAPPELVLSGAGLVGVAFDPLGGLVVASNDTAWRLNSLSIAD